MSSHHSNSVQHSRKSSRASTVDRHSHGDDDARMDHEILEELDEWKQRRRQRKQNKQQKKDETESTKQREKWEKAEQRRHDEMDKVRERLLQASRKRDSQQLREAIRDAETPEDPKNKSCPELRSEYRELRPIYDSAVELLTSIEKIENLHKAKKKIDHSTVVEIRSLNNMAEAVHQVVVATFTLLANDNCASTDHKEQQRLAKSLNSSWSRCQKECVVSGENALHKRINNLDSKSLTPATVCKVLGLLDPYDRKFVCGLSGAVGLLYDWVVGICEEKLLTDDKATKKRNKQKEDAEENEERERDENPYYDEDKKDEKKRRCGHCQIQRAAEHRD